TDDGFDFLGFNVRRYRTKDGPKVLTKPSKNAMKKIRRRLASEMRALRGANPQEIIGRLNPVIRGVAAYYRIGVSSDAFSVLDDYLWRLLYKWACRRHPTKGRRWVKNRYFGRYNKTRNDQWVFGDRQTGAYLHKFSWTPIVRHVPVAGRASPDDPALAQYWASRRRRKTRPPLASSLEHALRAQHGRCPRCGDYLLHDDHEPQSPREWETWFTAVRTALTREAVTTRTHGRTNNTARLVHTQCHRRHPNGAATGTDT
uniref:group II intron maturase-specific domain-containing protein n=1 Tax=Frankia sp. Cppng1_Ct_nod TaxID=2897162 RepID=UPI0024E08E33